MVVLGKARGVNWATLRTRHGLGALHERFSLPQALWLPWLGRRRSRSSGRLIKPPARGHTSADWSISTIQ